MASCAVYVDFRWKIDKSEIMNMKIHIIACAFLLAGFTACIDDESCLGGKAIPELTIAGNAEEMQVLNFNLGTDCVIRPNISYKGGTEENLTYTWSIGTYTNGTKGVLEVVSHERDLTYFFTQGGSYYAHLNVTDGVVGYAMDYQVNINRTFEEGYVLISKDEAGNGNMAFIKVMTPEEIEEGVEQIYMEHCLEQMNEGVSERGLVDVKIGDVTVGAWPNTSVVTRLMVSVGNKCYFIDLNTFTIISEIDYTTVFSGFKATDFLYSDALYYPCAYDREMGKFVHLDLQYMFGYEYSYFKNVSFDDFYLFTYAGSYYSTKVLFVNYDSPEVAEYNAYAPYYGLSTYFPSTLDMLADEELISTFMGGNTPDYPNITPLYILTRSKINRNKVSLYSMTSGSYVAPENFSTQECELTDDMVLPVQGTPFVASPVYNRHYYYVGNNVYVMLMENAFTLAKKDEVAISFPTNEEITYMSVNIDTEELYVATYDTTTKRGNFYIYDTADVRADNQTSPAPKKAYRNCADKISSILYKPRV